MLATASSPLRKFDSLTEIQTMAYDIPTNADLQEVEQEVLPVLTQDDELFSYFPIESEDADTLEWEQEDIYTGLMTVRGLNGQPGRVKNVGMKKWEVTPYYAGDYAEADEKEMTRLRKYGTYSDPAELDDIVGKKFKQLLTREMNLFRKVIADFLTTGTYSVLGQQGQVMKTDSFNITTATANPLWSVPSTSTPLADLRSIIAGVIGYDYDFGPDAKILMNTHTWHYMIANTNPADLYGRRTEGLGTFNNMGAVNQLLAGDGLPQIKIYDKCWFTDAGVKTFFIPTGKVVILGKRSTGKALGAMVKTRNANNPEVGPNSYNWVVDPFSFAQGNVLPVGNIPRTLQVHRGHNAALKVPFPRGILALTVA